MTKPQRKSKTSARAKKSNLSLSASAASKTISRGAVKIRNPKYQPSSAELDEVVKLFPVKAYETELT